MAQEQVNGILEGLKLAQSRRTANMQNAVEQARQQSQNEYQQNEIQARKDALGEQKRQFDITTKAAQAMHNLQVLQEEQKVTGNLQQGMSIPGAQQLPDVPGVINTGTQTYKVPGLDNPVTILSPEAYRNKQIQDRTAIEAPEHANRMEEISTQAENARKLAEQNRTDQLTQAMAIQNSENDRAKLERESRERVANNENGMRMQIAKMNAGLVDADGNPTSSVTPGIASNYLNQGLTGKMSAEDFAKSKLPSGPQKIISNAMEASGGRFLSDKEKSNLDSFEAIPQVFSNIDALNDLTKQKGLLAVHMPFSQAKMDTKNLQDQIEASMPQISRFLGETGRLSNQQIGMTVAALQPDLNPATSSSAVNVKRRDDALKTLRAEYEKTLSGLPEKQADIIRSQSKFHQIPFKGAQQNQPPGQTHLYFDAQGNQVQPGAQQ